MEDQRKVIMQQLLENDARERLGTIRTVKPDKAAKLENIILMNAQNGQLQGKVNEQMLLELLDQINKQEGSEGPTITFKRRAFDSDDDFDF